MFRLLSPRWPAALLLAVASFLATLPAAAMPRRATVMQAPFETALPAADEAAFQRRAAALLEWVRERPTSPGLWDVSVDPPTNHAANDLGKHLWPQILASLAVDPSGEGMLSQGSNRPPISVRQLARGLVHNAPEDNPRGRNPAVGYLYFSPVGLGWIVRAKPDFLADEELAVLFRQTIRFDPTHSALNMLTGQGTENHMLMGRQGGYLIAEAILARGPDDPISGEFYAEAQSWQRQIKAWILDTARTTYERGVGEWDSSTYYPYVLVSWLALHDHAADAQVRLASKAVLDWFAATMAVRSSWGMFGGSEQRSSVELHPWTSNLDQFAWLWWGGLPEGQRPEFRRSDVGQMVYAALSTYRPPPIMGRVARKEVAPALLGRLQAESKPSYLVHGAHSVRQQSRVLFQVAPEYTLGATLARPTGGWTGGDTQEVMWKLVIKPNSPEQAAWVATGPRGRDPWRQVGMWQGVLIDVWHHPENAAELFADAQATMADWRERRGETLRRVFPEDRVRGNTVTSRGDLLERLQAVLQTTTPLPTALPAMLEVSGVFVSIRALGVGLEPIPRGGWGGFLIELGTRREYGTAEAFRAAVAARDARVAPRFENGTLSLRTLAGEGLEFRYQTAGTYVEPEFDWGYGDDIPVGGEVTMAMPPFEFPTWPSGEGHGRVPRLRINGQVPRALSDPAIYTGPFLTLRDHRLTLTDGTSTFEVDYRGDEPVWMEK